MPARVLSVLIIGFWLVMTGLLARRIWFPEETRFAEITPQAVMELFASRSEPSRLEIYSNQNLIGTLNLTPPGRAPGSRRPVRVHINGTLQLGGALPLTAVRLGIKGHLLIGNEGQLRETEMRLSVGGPVRLAPRQEPAAELRLEQKGAETPLRITFFRAGVLIMDSASPEKPMPGDADPLAALLLPLAGLTPEEWKTMVPASAATAETPKISARQGTFSFAAHPPFAGYLITPADNTDSSRGFRAYLDASGEILRVETPIGYVLTQEDLALDGTPKPEPAP